MLARALLVLAACSTLARGQQPQLSVEAATYLAEAVAIMRQASFHRDSIDWTELRARAFAAAAGAVVPVDTYDAIRGALRDLGDHHSFLELSPELSEAERARKRERGGRPTPTARESTAAQSPFRRRRDPEGHLHEAGDGIAARVVIPQYGGPEPDRFAARIQQIVRELSEDEPIGWIVDLRGNGGGNMWPMLAGIGPVLGEGRIGAFQSVDGVQGHWYYRDGVSGVEGSGDGDFVGATVTDPLELDGTPPVAILIDVGTASSGEATAIAFKGRPKARFIGTETRGLSTSNAGHRMPDGANLVITVGLDVDRNGVAYDAEVQPDEPVPSPATDRADDRQLERALEWLAGQGR